MKNIRKGSLIGPGGRESTGITQRVGQLNMAKLSLREDGDTELEVMILQV